MAIYYHVTPTENLLPILMLGLQPDIGPRAAKLNEPVKAVYLFRDLVTAEDAIMNWLGDEFPDGTDLSMLAVTLDNPLPDHPAAAAYEVLCLQVIPPENIKNLLD